ncbi:MAG: transposase [Opitutaceae bacterium]
MTDDRHLSGRANRPGEPLGANAVSFPERRPLSHEVPSWVKDGTVFFITICAENRASRPLLNNDIAAHLIESVAFLHDRGVWFARLFLVMPDHVHGLISFPPGTAMGSRVASWKGYTSKTFGMRWQERFFDHRLRTEDSADEKAHYIRANPVRAGLTSTPGQWPYVFDAFTQ